MLAHHIQACAVYSFLVRYTARARRTMLDVDNYDSAAGRAIGFDRISAQYDDYHLLFVW